MRGQKVFVIVNHFDSKGGDHPLFGRFQPPVRSSEVQRHAQAQVVNGFVDSILAEDENANVIVLGDINDFEFSETVSILEGGVLTSLMNTLPKSERYSYVFEGNSQVLDQILVSDNLEQSLDRVRRRPRERRVRRPGLGPRPAGREARPARSSATPRSGRARRVAACGASPQDWASSRSSSRRR